MTRIQGSYCARSRVPTICSVLTLALILGTGVGFPGVSAKVSESSGGSSWWQKGLQFLGLASGEEASIPIPHPVPKPKQPEDLKMGVEDSPFDEFGYMPHGFMAYDELLEDGGDHGVEEDHHHHHDQDQPQFTAYEETHPNLYEPVHPQHKRSGALIGEEEEEGLEEEEDEDYDL